MPLKYLKKIKYFSKITTFVFFISLFGILFVYIDTAKAYCTWFNNKGSLTENVCANAGAGMTLNSSGCNYVSKPTDGQPEEYICCCAPDSTGINSTMPNLKMPDLQVKIPGLIFSTLASIKEQCQKDDQGNLTNCSFPWIGEYIAAIYKYAIGIVGILAAVVLMIGGIMWIVAGGNATAIGEAKAWIGASLTGLVIALCSYLILYQVNPALVNFKPLALGIVKEFKITPEVLSYTGLTGGYGTPGTALSYNGNEWDDLIKRVADQAGVDAVLLKAMMATESSGNAAAVSSQGAQGLMQLMPKTAQWLNVEKPFDPEQNLTGGAVYIKGLLKNYNGNLETALAAYNWGPGNVQNQGLANMPAETKIFINKVTGYYNKFKGS